MDFSIAAVIFWGSALALLYTYIGYPLFLAIFSQGASAEAPSPASLPKVSVIVAAYNEEECIAEKIRNTFGQDYSAHLLECIVVSDGSTDRTAEIVRGISEPRLRLLIQSPRQGKCPALVRAVKEATGEVLVFTDANAMLEPSALSCLLRRFSDPRVGLVSGKGIILEHRDGSIHAVTNRYLEYEQFIRERESRFGFIAWADGAFYGLKKILFRGLKPQHANDFLHPIQTALAGYRAVLEPGALFREPSSGGAGSEFRRQVRMIGQGIYIIISEGPKLLAAGRWIVLWQLISHRLMRWAGVIFLAGAFGANLYLAPESGFYLTLLGLQLAFYSVAAAGGLGERLGWRLPVFAIPYYFCLVHLAAMFGFFRVVAGSVQATWNPARSG